MERMPYSTDLSDGQWALIEPLVTAWKQERVSRSATGDPGSCDLREVVNALLYQNRTGCQWRLLPHDLPAWSAVFYYSSPSTADSPSAAGNSHHPSYTAGCTAPMLANTSKPDGGVRFR
jgi:transposase